jgi:cytochrome c oxidase subunit II
VHRHPLAQMLAVGAVASAIGVALALTIDWFPARSATQSDSIDRLYDVLLVASVPIFILVQVVALYCVWRFRMRRGEELKDGPPIHGHTGLEIFWTAVPAVLLIGLCSYAYVVLADIEEPLPDTMEVGVRGEQFTWSFEYPQEGGEPVRSNQLYLPQGRPVRFNITTQDVIHSFWVPEFRMKQDAVPGLTTHTRVTPTELGTYPVVCAELCGLGHAVMRQTVRVVPPAEFQQWLTERRGAGEPADGEEGAPAADAQQVFSAQENGCAGCHTLADAGASGTIGPNLDETLRDRDEDYIRRAIVDPEADTLEGFSPGVMPSNYEETLTEQEIDALVSYLAEVTG